MAVSTTELKGKIKIEDKATKELQRLRKELKAIKRDSKDLDKTLKKKKKLNVDTKKATKDIKKIDQEAKGLDKELRKAKDVKINDKGTSVLSKIKKKFEALKKDGNIKLAVKDMASNGALDAIQGRFKGLGKAGKIGLKIVGKHPALAVVAAIGLAIGKLAKSAWNDVKVKINDVTQWGIQKIKQGLDSLKDKVINVTIKGYDQYSDYKSRTNFIEKTMNFKDYDKLAFKVAKNTRSNVSDVRDQMTKLIQMSPNVFGKDTNEAARFYQTAIQSFRKGGSSNEEATAAMYQLNQGLASNTLQGDELHTIRESAPLMAKMIEKEVGVGIKEAGAKGLLTAEVVKNAILKHADEINKEFQHIPMNFKDAWVIGGNLIQEKVITPMYERMQKFMSTDKVMDFFNSIYDKASKMLDGIWDLLDITNFGGIDFSILQQSFAPLGDFINEIYKNIVSGSPAAQEAINTLGQVVNGAFEGMGDIFSFFKDVAEDVFQFLKENPEFVKKAIQTLASVWELKWNEMKIKAGIIKDILPLVKGLCDMVNSVSDAVKSLKKWWGDTLDYMKSHGFNVGGHGPQGLLADSMGRGRAMGEGRIPYDNYPINAHEGEKLLTKREANEYEKGRGIGNGGVIINMYGTTIREEADIDLFTDRLVKKMKLELEGGA